MLIKGFYEVNESMYDTCIINPYLEDLTPLEEQIEYFRVKAQDVEIFRLVGANMLSNDYIRTIHRSYANFKYTYVQCDQSEYERDNQDITSFIAQKQDDESKLIVLRNVMLTYAQIHQIF